MTKFLFAVVAVLSALFVIALLALYLQGKVYKSKLKKQESDFIKQWNDMQSKQLEILNNAKKQKEDLHSGGNADSFNSSLDVLQKSSKARKKKAAD